MCSEVSNENDYQSRKLDLQRKRPKELKLWGRVGGKNDNKFKAWRRWLKEGRGQSQDLSFTVLWKIQLRFQKQLCTFNKYLLPYYLGKWSTLSAKTVKALSNPLWDCLTWLLLCHPLIPDFIPWVIFTLLKAFPQLLFLLYMYPLNDYFSSSWKNTF